MKDKYFVTLESLRDNDACKPRYDYLVSCIGNTRRKIGLSEILKHNGIEDAIWALCAVKHTAKFVRDWRQFMADCAESVIDNYERHFPGDTRVRDCIAVVRNPKSTEQQSSAAESAAWSAESAESVAWSAEFAESAVRSAAWSAVWSAESAARSAAWSAESAAWSAEFAARSAAWSAAWSAESAAWSAERERQKEFFINRFCEKATR